MGLISSPKLPCTKKFLSLLSRLHNASMVLALQSLYLLFKRGDIVAKQSFKACLTFCSKLESK